MPYPHLLSPIKIGPVTLRHRAVMSGHGMALGYGKVGISEEYEAYLVARAVGGAAMVGTESAPVDPSSFSRSLGIMLYSDDVVPSMRRTAGAVHEAGSRLAVTLWHGGHKDSFIRGRFALAPSPVPNMAGEVPKQITAGEIAHLITAYGAAAKRCRIAGLDAVEIQTATDYLLGSFLSPVLNRRTDAYGGSFENRIRIVRQILESVREAAGGGMAVGIRTSATHGIKRAAHDYDLDESVAAMRAFAQAGLVDYVSVMTGSAWTGGSSIPDMVTPRIQLLAEGKAFRQALSVPVVIAGRIRTPEEADQAIRDGAADIVAMARSWIADPDWGRKVESGQAERIRPCMSCNQACVGFVFQGIPGSCVINPAAGRETKLPAPEPSPSPKRIAIVGGGPAGMEAARVLAERGHHVSLHEASSELGGQMRLAAAAPFRSEMLPALAWWKSELERLQVRVILNSRLSPGAAELADADEIVWAIGAAPGHTALWQLRPYLFDGIPGTAGLDSGRDVLSGAAPGVTGEVLVIDEEGGWPAVSLVETLVRMPGVTGVTVTTPERDLGDMQLSKTWELLPVKRRLREAKIRMMTETLVETVSGGQACLMSGETIGPFDRIILSTGTAAGETPEGGHSIGDCVAPRGIWAATSDAAALARAL